MTGGVLARKEEGGHLRQQPLIVQRLPCLLIPAPLFHIDFSLQHFHT